MTLGGTQHTNYNNSNKTLKIKIKGIKCNRPDGMKQAVSFSLTKGLGEEPSLHRSSNSRIGAIQILGEPHLNWTSSCQSKTVKDTANALSKALHPYIPGHINLKLSWFNLEVRVLWKEIVDLEKVQEKAIYN